MRNSLTINGSQVVRTYRVGRDNGPELERLLVTADGNIWHAAGDDPQRFANLGQLGDQRPTRELVCQIANMS